MTTWWKQIITDKQGRLSLKRIGLDGLIGLVFLYFAVGVAFQVVRIKVAESASSYSIVNQTTHNGTGDTPNVGGFNAGTKTNTTVSGTGTSASVILNYVPLNHTYTGAQQTWTVPTGVTSVTIDMAGGSGSAGGGDNPGAGGNGGRVQTTFTVTADNVLYIYVGGAGSNYTAGYNGGGSGGLNGCGTGAGGGGGGGASDIRIGGIALDNRRIVAGGGGGGAGKGPLAGGGGGDTTGANGNGGCNQAGGGTQTAGGPICDGSGCCSYSGASGVIGSGGAGGGGGYGYCDGGGGGGGGGYYGGGGGCGGEWGGGASGAGGGSSYCNATYCSNTTHTQSYRSGNGYVAISYPGLYASSGTIESATVDLGAGAAGAVALGNLSWNAADTTSLAGYWQFDEGSGTVAADSSGNGKNGTVSNSAAWTTVGKFGNAFYGNGGSSGYYVSMGNLSLNSQSAITYEAWIYTIGGTGLNGIFDSFGASTNYATQLTLNSSITNLRARVSAGSDTYGYTTDNSITANAWHHVAMVFDGTGAANADRLKVYVDGSQRNLTFNGTIPATTYSGSQSLHLGSYWTTPVNFAGRIDEARVYTRALTAQEIATHANQSTIQLATRSDTSFTSNDYKGPDGTTNTFFTLTGTSGTAIPSSFDNNRYLRYKAFLATSNTAYTPSLNDIVITIVPDAPTGVTIAEPTAQDQLVVNWNSQGDATSYYVQRSSNGSSWSTAVDSSGLTTYTDTSLPDNTRYYYQVAAYGSGGTSSYVASTPTNRYTLSPTPSISEASAPQKSASTWYNTGFNFQNALSWSTGGIGSYRYYWTTASSFTWTTTGTTTWTTSTITPTVASPNSYYLYARSYNGDSVETATTWSSGPWRYETAGPTAFALASPASNTWTSSLTPTLGWNASSDADSGLAKYKLYVAGVLNKDNISSASTWTTADTLITEGDYSWSVVAVDNAANTTTSTDTRIIRIDRTAPGAYTNTLTEGTGPTYQYVSGTTTLYYNPVSTGGFSVSCSSSPTDSGSGMQKVNFPSLGTGFTGDGDDASAPYSAAYAWDETATNEPGAKETIAYDNVNWTTASAFTITKDTTAPISGAVSYSDGFATSAPSITLTRGSDASSGIDASRGVLEYAREIYDGSSVPDFTSSTWTVLSGSNPSSPYTDSNIALSYAYKYRYTTYDNVSNSYTWTSDNAALYGLRITAPNGSEQYEIEGTKNITWSARNTLSTVDIYYSTTGSAPWEYCLDADDIPAEGVPTGSNWTFAWKLPVTVSDTVKVRIVGPNSTADVSDNDFYLVPHPTITIKAPVGTSSWRIGDLQSIQWTSNYSVDDTVTVWYSTNGGADWTTILEEDLTYDDGIVVNDPAATLTGTQANSVNWTIPDIAGTTTQAQVRITYNSRSELSPTTNWTAASVNFSIIGPGITIDTPSDAPWKVRELKTITWTTTGSKSANVSLYYSTNGTAWTLFDASQPTSNDGSYGWTVIAGAVSDTTQLKVADLGWTLTSETTPFVVRRPTIEVTAPNTDSLTLVAGDGYSVEWSSEAPVKAGSGNGTVKLQVSTTGAAGTYSDISGATSLENASGSNSWTWTIDASSETTQGRIKVIDNELTDITDASNYNFTIRYPTLSLTTFPAASEPTDTDGVTALVVGDIRTITWTTERNFGNNLIIECLVGGSVEWSVGGLQTGGSYTHPNGSYEWTIPAEAEGDSVVIRIKDSTRPTILATSNTFKVIASPKYKVMRPNSTDDAGANYAIAKKVYYSNAPTNTQGITWTGIGDSARSAEPVKISFTTDNGVTWTTAAGGSGTPNDGNYELWNAPFEAVSSNTKVRVWYDADADNQPDSGEMQGDSDAFRVVSSITINQPIAGTTWTVGTSGNTISWSTIGAITQVRARYYNGADWTILSSVISNTDPAGVYNNNYSKSYSWTIPNENAYLSVSGQLQITGISPSGATAIFHTIGISVVAPRFDTFTVTSPSADSGYYIGDTATLEWTWVGGLAGPQELSYSSNGTNWTVCTGASALANSISTFGWTIPSDALGSSIRLRISDTDSQRSTSTKDTTTFAVLARPTITITSPTATPTWYVGKGYTISWSATAGINDNLTIESSLDDEATSWTTIASAQNASEVTGISWTVLEAVLPAASESVTRQIRITDATRGSSGLASSVWTAAYTAYKPLITITSPSAGAYWSVASTPQITWTMTGGKTAGTVDIYCDTDHDTGETWSLIGNDVSYTPNGSTSWTWTVANDIGATSIKIAETTRSNQAWTTSGSFNIVGGLTVVTPSLTGIGLVGGDPYSVTWTSAGTFDTVRLQFYNGTAWRNMNNTTSPNDYTEVSNSSPYSWTVPDITTTAAKIRIYDPDYSSQVTDESDDNFAIGGTPYLTITSPVQGAAVSWTVGTGAHTIQWTGSSNVNNNIALYYSTNGTTWWTIDNTGDANKDDSISWTAPQAALGAAASGTNYFKVVDLSHSNTAMTWTPSITVTTPGIDVGDPSAASGFVVVSEQKPLTWVTDGGVATVDVYYDQDQTVAQDWSLISNDLANTSNGSTTWTWTVPNDVGPTSIKVEDISRTAYSYGTSTSFTVCGKVNDASVALSGAPVTVGNGLTISWSTTGQISQSDIQIVYYVDGDYDDTWTVAPSGDLGTWNITTNSGTCIWTVPTSIGADYVNTDLKIRVRDQRVSSNATSYEDSSAFQIKGTFNTPAAPTSGAQWTVDSVQNIRWTVTGNMASANLTYYTPATDWTAIASGTGVSVSPGLNTFAWTVPDHITVSAQVKIEDASDSDVSTTSATFSIVGTVDLKSPNTNVSWIIGKPYTVTWSVTAGDESITNVKLQYSTDSGNAGTWKDMANGTLGQATTVATSGDSGSYTWTIPADGTNTTSARVRVYEENSLSNTDMSAVNFAIASPTISITQPGLAQRGSNSLVVNEPYDIIWTTDGTVSTVKIEASYDNQYSWTVVAWTVGNVSPYTYTWTPTSAIESGAWIKITDLSATHTGNSGYSDDAFSVLPTPALTLRDPTASWIAGKNYAIEWTATSQALLGNVTLWYSLDGSTWWTIDTDQPNTDAVPTSSIYYSYSWTLPDFYSADPYLTANDTSVQLKITDSNRNTSDTTANFTIAIPTITVTQPNGSEYWAVGDTAQIKWTYQGALAGDLTIQCDKTAGTSFGPDIIWSVASINKTGGTTGDGTYAYTWTILSSPDVTGTAVKFKVLDSQRDNSNDTSDAVFNIIAVPEGTVTVPTSASHFYADETWTISWTIHGLIGKDASGNPNLVIQYSDDNFASNVWSVSSGVSRGTTQVSGEADSGNYVGTYAWDIPGGAHTSNTMKIRVFDPARSIYWTSEAFPLTGGFAFRDPADSAVTWSLDVAGNSDTSQTEWTAGTGRTIYWYNKGSHDLVKLQYLVSTNGTTWTTANYTNIAALIDNSDAGTVYDSGTGISTYSWTVADPETANYPQGTDPNSAQGYYYAKFKLIDADPATMGTEYEISKESPIFKITYYQIKFALTNEYNNIVSVPMDFRDIKWSIANTEAIVEADATTYQHKYPYGPYTTLISGGSGTDYGDFQVSWTANANQTVSKKIYSNTYLQTEWETKANFFYDEDNDAMKVNSWLERRKSPISEDVDLGVGGDAYIHVYSSSAPEDVLWTLTDSTADTNGNYWFDWTATGLTAGVSYFAKCGTYYSGDLHENKIPFSVTISKKLSELATQIDEKTGEIKAVAEATWTLANTISTQTGIIETKVGDVETAVEETIPTSITAVKTDTGKVLTATETTIPSKIETETGKVTTQITSKVEPQVASGILNRDTLVKQGDTVTIRYRTSTGLSPVITVYDPSNVVKIAAAIMTEVGASGVYEYDVTFETSWDRGDYTIVVSEATKGTVDAMTMTVSSADIEDVATSVSSILGTVVPIRDIKTKIDAFTAAFNVIEENIGKAAKALAGAKTDTSGAVEATNKLTSLYKSLKEMSTKINELGGTIGLNLEKLYDVSEARAKDIGYIRNKTQELKALMELNQQMIENAAKEEPAVTTWFEYK